MKEVLENYLENIQVMHECLKRDSLSSLKNLKMLKAAKSGEFEEKINEINAYLMITQKLQLGMSEKNQQKEELTVDLAEFGKIALFDKIKSKIQFPQLSSIELDHNDISSNLKKYLVKVDPNLASLSQFGIPEGSKTKNLSFEQLLASRLANLNSKIDKLKSLDKTNSKLQSVNQAFILFQNTFCCTINLYGDIVEKMDFSLKSAQKQNENLKDTLEDFMNKIRQYKQACNLSETRYSYLQNDMDFQKDCYEQEIAELQKSILLNLETISSLQSEIRSLTIKNNSNSKGNGDMDSPPPPQQLSPILEGSQQLSSLNGLKKSEFSKKNKFTTVR